MKSPQIEGVALMAWWLWWPVGIICWSWNDSHRRSLRPRWYVQPAGGGGMDRLCSRQMDKEWRQIGSSEGNEGKIVWMVKFRVLEIKFSSSLLSLSPPDQGQKRWSDSPVLWFLALPIHQLQQPLKSTSWVASQPIHFVSTVTIPVQGNINSSFEYFLTPSSFSLNSKNNSSNNSHLLRTGSPAPAKLCVHDLIQFSEHPCEVSNCHGPHFFTPKMLRWFPLSLYSWYLLWCNNVLQTWIIL